MSANKKNDFNVMLVCRNAAGEPTFFACVVSCTQEQYGNIDHLDMVCEAAESKGFVIPEAEPYLCDPDDALGRVLDYGADFESAPKLDLEEYLAKPAEVTA